MIIEDFEVTSPIKKLEAPPARVADETPKVIVPASVEKKNLVGGNELKKVPVSQKGSNVSNPTGGTEKAPVSKVGTKRPITGPKTFLLKTDKNMFPVLTNVPNETGCSAITCLKNLLSEALKRPKNEPPTGININYIPANCSRYLNYMLT